MLRAKTEDIIEGRYSFINYRRLFSVPVVLIVIPLRKLNKYLRTKLDAVEKEAQRC